ncbi:hypothetical protein PMY56_10245 [Clostridium tertium]|uniref:hypothetical protein n=1 Tax=Clostridium TaxID=1485 RepID=UPI00232DE964|nr:MULTISPECIES: hypothetical protein [Clostridium]MDB1922118.1 hypothetical protein [Clostridium tertium]MDB1926521.1 hypothetical protein [Clostridium tertium]MDB1930905.1 hypothetical protein [Clostridium tertium]MDU6363085.1 hypothetical protein [Clostridium sp.]
MNQGQEKFLGFILERVQEGKVDEAKSLLAESFKKQSEGTFSHEYIIEFIPKMIALLKPEKVEEVKAIMQQFAQNLNK